MRGTQGPIVSEFSTLKRQIGRACVLERSQECWQQVRHDFEQNLGQQQTTLPAVRF